jgi:hypothetical protein
MNTLHGILTDKTEGITKMVMDCLPGLSRSKAVQTSCLSPADQSIKCCQFAVNTYLKMSNDCRQ